jgi:hypothetical protein
MMQQGAGVRTTGMRRASLSDSKPYFPGMPVVLIQGKSDSAVRRVIVDQSERALSIVDARPTTSAPAQCAVVAGAAAAEVRRHAYKTTTYYWPSRCWSCEIDGWATHGAAVKAAWTTARPEGPDATPVAVDLFFGASSASNQRLW